MLFSPTLPGEGAGGWGDEQSSCRTILPVGVKDGRRRRRKMAVPRAAAAYGRQLKNNDIFYSKNYISFIWISFCDVDLIPHCDFGLDLFSY